MTVQLDMIKRDDGACVARESQYFTPRSLADRIVTWARVSPGMRVLEPSAGSGNIVRALVDAGCFVTAIEKDERIAGALSIEFFGPAPAVNVVHDDFLSVRAGVGVHDLAVMNPPLNGGAGPEHVARALLFASRVVSVLRLGDLAGQSHKAVLWDRCVLSRLAVFSRRPSWAGEAADMYGAKSDFCVVAVNRKGVGPVMAEIEWWT